MHRIGAGNQPRPNNVELIPPVHVPIVPDPHPAFGLPDVLRYATQAITEPGDQQEQRSPMNAEDKEFLECALQSLSLDVVSELKKYINLLQNVRNLSQETDPGEYEEALSSITDCVGNIDVANDFQKIGGFSILKPCLKSNHNGLRWKACELIAELCQNNPHCQKKLIEMELIPVLLKMIETDRDDVVQIKALYAVSCATRESAEGLQELMNRDGFAILLRVMNKDKEPLNVKTSFLVGALCRFKPSIREELVKLGYVEQLISYLDKYVALFEGGRNLYLEHFLGAAITILQGSQEGHRIAKRPELNFRDILDRAMKIARTDEDYKEEYELAKLLIKVVYGDGETFPDERKPWQSAAYNSLNLNLN